MTNEQAFLTAILERPDDDATKLVYADWLEEQDDPRGEYLRLMLKVRQERIVTPKQRQRHKDLSAELAEVRNEIMQDWRADRSSSPEHRERERRERELERQLADLSKQIRQQVPARLQELAATLDTAWLAVVSDPLIEGCGKNGGGGWSLRFDILCDNTWADLKPTDDNNVRHCETCSQNVHYCDNLADAREHSHDGHCITVDLGIIRREGDLRPRMMFVGRPSQEDLRQTYEDDMDPVSQARLEARKQNKGKRPRKE